MYCFVFQLFIHFYDTVISAPNNHARTFVRLFITMLLSSGNPLLNPFNNSLDMSGGIDRIIQKVIKDLFFKWT